MAAAGAACTVVKSTSSPTVLMRRPPWAVMTSAESRLEAGDEPGEVALGHPAHERREVDEVGEPDRAHLGQAVGLGVGVGEHARHACADRCRRQA